MESAYSTAQAARQEARARTTALNEQETAVDRTLSQLAAYAESIAGDDVQMIQSA